MPTPPQLPPAFIELLKDSSLTMMRRMQQVLSETITTTEKLNTQTAPPPKPAPAKLVNPSDFVVHVDVDELKIDQCDVTVILSELESLQLHSKSQSDKIKTQWLSPSDEDYVYGNIVNRPKPISGYPGICKLMSLVNDNINTTGDMDAALVSCFPSPEAHLRLHEDAEALIAQDSSICTVSFGPPRTLEFVCTSKTKEKKRDYTADLSLPATNLSMNIMKPGCQQVLKHRVLRASHDDAAPRFSISFRKIVLPTSNYKPKPTPSPVHRRAPNANDTTTPKESVILMAGDSFFERLDPDRLGKKKKRVINIAKGGSKIDAVLRSIDSFVKDNPDKHVSKRFISIGTNDIRTCTNGIMHLKQSLCNFMKTVKQLLPDTSIYLQSLLPIPNNGYRNLESNILNMNNLIFNLCSRYKLFFVDTFHLFIDHFGRRNLALFPGYDEDKKFYDIHPNSRGMGVLAKSFIFIIHSKWFNPMGY